MNQFASFLSRQIETKETKQQTKAMEQRNETIVAVGRAVDCQQPVARRYAVRGCDDVGAYQREDTCRRCSDNKS